MTSPVPAAAAARNPALARAVDRVDRTITGVLARSGVPVLRIGLGLVFLWFGALKLIPGLSPAADLAARRVQDDYTRKLMVASAGFQRDAPATST